jgi:hypothetical protein
VTVPADEEPVGVPGALSVPIETLALPVPVFEK